LNNRLPWQGLKVRIHFLFWIVILLAVMTGRFLEIVTLFVLVIIHEMGHVTAAWSLGWRMKTLELLPFGGVVQTDEWGSVPIHEELIVALSGPFHNVMMILAGGLFMWMGWWDQEWTRYFIHLNSILVGFNLLPIYPLDGGRVMQALLGYVLPYQKAVAWTVKISTVAAGLLMVWGWIGSIHVNLVMIAVFLLHANWQAWRQREFQFMRFLVSRKSHPPPPSSRLITLRVSPRATLLSVVKNWRKEAYHVIMVRGTRRVIPEEVVLSRLLDHSEHDRCIGEL
jgi:stage IV sporulation protein FB